MQSLLLGSALLCFCAVLSECLARLCGFCRLQEALQSLRRLRPGSATGTVGSKALSSLQPGKNLGCECCCCAIAQVAVQSGCPSHDIAVDATGKRL